MDISVTDVAKSTQRLINTIKLSTREERKKILEDYDEHLAEQDFKRLVEQQGLN